MFILVNYTIYSSAFHSSHKILETNNFRKLFWLVVLRLQSVVIFSWCFWVPGGWYIMTYSKEQSNHITLQCPGSREEEIAATVSPSSTCSSNMSSNGPTNWRLYPLPLVLLYGNQAFDTQPLKKIYNSKYNAELELVPMTWDFMIISETFLVSTYSTIY